MARKKRDTTVIIFTTFQDLRNAVLMQQRSAVPIDYWMNNPFYPKPPEPKNKKINEKQRRS